MSVLRVVEPGMFATVQDLGRSGFSAIGVPIGGAADPLSLRVGNRLLGNPDNTAALEMTLVGGVFEFKANTECAIVGGGASIRIGVGGSSPREIPQAHPVQIQAGARLEIGRINAGSRVYLCIGGGVQVPRLFGSAATLPNARLGGLEGRCLRAGDHLAIGAASPHIRSSRDICAFQLIADLVDTTLRRRIIRASPGAHAPLFSPGELDGFWQTEFTVSPRSDRAGIRLGGPPLAPPFGGRMPSEGMMWGAIQVPGSGAGGSEPIILMPDGPTTGGYPVIASVASVDLPVLGQLRPLDRIRFEQITPAQARELFAQQESEFARILPPSASTKDQS